MTGSVLKLGERITTSSHIPIKSDPIEIFWGPGDDVDVRWSSDVSTIYFVRELRGHQKAVLYAADVGTGEARTILEETSGTFLDLPKSSRPA